jgi:hypothetical protein
MNRREFFLAWRSQSRSTSIEAEVIEVFSTSEGPSALLVHHASESTRNAFGEWLRAHDGARIACLLRSGTSIEGRIFRVKMCFGRGLVLMRQPVELRTKDVVDIR